MTGFRQNLLVSVFLIFFCAVFFPSLVRAEETIRSITIDNLLEDRRSDIRTVIRLEPGDPFRFEDLELAINDLRKWGVFENVEVLVRHENGAVDLTFELPDAFFIKEVKIHGNFPLLEKRIRRAIFMNSGDLYQEEKIPEQIDRLIAFYEKQGWRNTEVLIRTEKDLDARRVTLIVSIEKGDGYRIGKVQLKGNSVFEARRIENKIGRFFGYSPDRLKKNLESIRELYRDAGYFRTRVKVVDLQFDEKKREANFTLEIREGKKTEIVFEGNAHQREETLLKKVSLYETGDTDDFELDYSKNQLIGHYRNVGYPEVDVSYQKEKISPTHTKVTFEIKEGPHRIVKSVDFEGNAAFSDRRLRKEIQTKGQGLGVRGVLLEEVLADDLKKLESFYDSEGFLETKASPAKRTLLPTRDKYLIEIPLEEGPKTEVSSLRFEGLSVFKPEELRKFLVVQERSPFSKRRLEEDRQGLVAYYAEHGHPYAEVEIETEKEDDQKTKVVYKIDEGPEVFVGRILIVGPVRTRKETILNALAFKEGEQFNPQSILKSQTELRKLGVFNSISLETLGLQGKAEVVHVVVRAEEKKDKLLDLDLSYDTDTELKARLIFSKLNLFGRAKHLDLKLTAGTQLNRAELAYTDPRFWGTSWQMLANVFAEHERRPQFEASKLGTSVTFLKEFNPRFSIYGRGEFQWTDFAEDDLIFFHKMNPAAASAQNLEILKPENFDNTTAKLQFFTAYDGRDRFGDPHSGFYAAGIVDGVLQSHPRFGFSSFMKLGTRAGYWWSPFSLLTIANALRFDWIVPFKSDTLIPAQELIFLGGDDTLRGFEEDALKPLGARIGLVHNFEAQFRLFKGFQFVGFLDTGFAVDHFRDIDLKTLRHSAGLGLRYATPVGPIRLDYGWVLDRLPGEPGKRLHFTFGYFF